MRMHLFGEIVYGASKLAQMHSNEFGEAVQQTWLDLPRHNANITLHEFVLMPNHVHGIIQIDIDNGHGVTEIVRQFKAFSSRRINVIRNSYGEKIWQRGFHDNIIRNRHAYLRITGYIKTNPIRWADDEYFR